jgi:hypothetical protein
MEEGRHVITVFGSASLDERSDDRMTAYQLGKNLAGAGFTLCNGGYGGTMEASARGAKEAGGRTIGVITRFYANEKPNQWIDNVITVDSMMERLTRLILLGDGYVALRGGTGTLLEIAAVWEMLNKGVMERKPFVVLGSFWDGLVGALRSELTREGRHESALLVTTVRTPAECRDILIDQLGVRYEA